MKAHQIVRLLINFGSAHDCRKRLEFKQKLDAKTPARLMKRAFKRLRPKSGGFFFAVLGLLFRFSFLAFSFWTATRSFVKVRFNQAN